MNRYIEMRIILLTTAILVVEMVLRCRRTWLLLNKFEIAITFFSSTMAKNPKKSRAASYWLYVLRVTVTTPFPRRPFFHEGLWSSAGCSRHYCISLLIWLRIVAALMLLRSKPSLAMMTLLWHYSGIFKNLSRPGIYSNAFSLWEWFWCFF